MFKKSLLSAIALAIAVSISVAAVVIFLKPFLKEKLLKTLEADLGSDIKVSALELGLLRGVIVIEGLAVKNPGLIEYCRSAQAGTAVLDVDLARTIIQRELVFENIFVKNLSLVLRNKEEPAPAFNALPVPPAVTEGDFFSPESLHEKARFGGLYIKKLLLEDAELVFEYHNGGPAPNVVTLIDIDGSVNDLYASLPGGRVVRGEAHLSGLLNARREGKVKVDGLFAGSDGLFDFDLDIDLKDADLIPFSAYFAKTSLAMIKGARVDLHSDAGCQKNKLDAKQRVRIYDIKLDDIKPTDEDMLFGLPAKTVIKFFKDSGGEVEFSFNISGPIDDPQFDYGPVLEKVLNDALRDKIMARLRELPREVIRMSERALKESLEGQQKIEKIEKKIRDIEKKLKKLDD